MWRRAAEFERRDAHQPVHAAFGLQPAIGVGAVDLDRRRFDAGAFAGALLEPLDLVVVLLGPADIHAQQHLGPVLRLGAAGAGMHFEIAVVAVGLARQQAFDLAPLRLVVQLFELGFGLRDDIGVALGFAETDQLDRLVDLALDAAIAFDRPFEPGALAQHLLRFARVIP